MREAAEALRLTAEDLYSLGVSDQIIQEPLGGAHRNPEQAIESVKVAIDSMLSALKSKKPKDLINERRKKFLKLGSKGLAAQLTLVNGVNRLLHLNGQPIEVQVHLQQLVPL